MSRDPSREDLPEIPFTEEVVLNAYAHGYFPMGCPEDDLIRWYRPDPRAILPLDDFHISRRLRRILKKRDYEVRINTCFDSVMRHCMEMRPDTWITEKMIRVYRGLHRMGFAHSLEIYRHGNLCGGLYGIAIRGLFCGESMFHLLPNHSKIALCELVARLRERGFSLLDSQFPNPHMEQFHLILIPDAEYVRRLQQALALPVRFA